MELILSRMRCGLEWVCSCVLVTQSRPLLYDPMDCGLSGSSVHGVLQARIMEWIAIPFSRGFSWPRDQTRLSCMAGRFFTIWATRDLERKIDLSQRVIQYLSHWIVLETAISGWKRKTQNGPWKFLWFAFFSHRITHYKLEGLLQMI